MTDDRPDERDQQQPDAGLTGRDETPQRRADRNMVELLQELRVLVTGIQVVFAFLLGIAFTARFTQLSPTQQYVYVAALLMAVLSVAVLATPVAIHRGLFRCGMKERIVILSSHCARLGMLLLCAALDCAVFLIIDVVLGRVAASVVSGCVGVAFVGLWFVFPWVLRR